MSESTLTIAVLLPEVLGTYGDTGNAQVLAERARRRNMGAQILSVGLSDPVPATADIYVLGGGEDTAQMLASQRFRADRGLFTALDAGRPLLAVCASLQVLGHWYRDASGKQVSGLGVLDVTTDPQGSRAIGELVTQPMVDGLTEPLTGFENHGGATTLGPDARPLGRVLSGVGNGVPWMPIDEATAGSAADVAVGAGAGTGGTEKQRIVVDGAVQGSIIATYLHGPVLARNPELADLLLTRATGVELAPLEVPGVAALRAERLAAAGL